MSKNVNEKIDVIEKETINEIKERLSYAEIKIKKAYDTFKSMQLSDIHIPESSDKYLKQILELKTIQYIIRMDFLMPKVYDLINYIKISTNIISADILSLEWEKENRERKEKQIKEEIENLFEDIDELLDTTMNILHIIYSLEEYGVILPYKIKDNLYDAKTYITAVMHKLRKIL